MVSTESGTLLHKGVPAQRNIQFVSERSPKHRFLPVFQAMESNTQLADTEHDVKEQIVKLYILIFEIFFVLLSDSHNSSETNSPVAGIVFMCSEKESDPSTFPFQPTTRFLDLSGPTLLQKLTIVPSLPGLDLNSRLGHLKQFGTHILDVSEPSVVLPRLLSWASAGEEERRDQMVEIYRRAATSVRRNAEQAVILLAGHSGHGKSKTVNRLIGQDLLNVGRATLGSTTKVRGFLDGVWINNNRCLQ